MIPTILLVFSMNDMPPQISQKKYHTLDECADFVELLANKRVVDNDYRFRFTSIEPSDGSVHIFEGQCIVDENLRYESKSRDRFDSGRI